MEKRYGNTEVRGMQQRTEISSSLEDFDSTIRNTGKELLEMYIRSLDGDRDSVKIDQALSFISGKLLHFPIDEREMILGEIIINIDDALKSSYLLKTVTYASQKSAVYSSIFNYLEKQLQQGAISSAGAVFREALYRANTSIKKQHALNWLYERNDQRDYGVDEPYPFNKKAIEELGDEIQEYLLEQKEYALLLMNFYDLDLTYEQCVAGIRGLPSSTRIDVIQKLAKYIPEYDTRPIAQAIKDAWLSQITLSEYKIFVMNQVEVQTLHPFFVNNTLLMQWNFEPSDFGTMVNSILQLPEVSDEVVLHIGTQIFELQDLQNESFYTAKHIRAFSNVFYSARFYLNFQTRFPQDPVGAKTAAMQFPWLMESSKEWLMDLQEMTPERQREMDEQILQLPEDQHAAFAEQFARQGVIGTSEEREATLKKILQNVPMEHKAATEKRFREKGVTNGQMESWLGYHAFKVPEGWDPKVVGKLMFRRLEQGISKNIHDASYFLSHFIAPDKLRQNDETTKKRKKTYDSMAQKWLNNYISTPAETLILAWQNRDAALADGCADNPGALVQWANANAVKNLLEQCDQPFDLTTETDRSKLAFLTETVRCTSPQETLRIWNIIKNSHNTECFFRPASINLGDGYSGEIFRKDDPRGTTLGADSGCCMSVGGASEACIVAGYTDPRYGFFALYQEGKLVAQSLLYINQESSKNTIVCDNIQASGGRDPENIVLLYQKFFSIYAPQNSSEISRVHVGMDYSSVGHSLPLIPPSELVLPALPIYTDADDTQRLLFDAKLMQVNNNIAIQWQDEKPCVKFTDTPVPMNWEPEEE